MEEEPWRNHWKRNHGCGIMEEPRKPSMRETSGERQKALQDPSEKHLEGIWEAFQIHLGQCRKQQIQAVANHFYGWKLRKHLGGIWMSGLTKLQHF